MKYLDQYKKLHKKQKYGVSGTRLYQDIKGVIPKDVSTVLDYGAGRSELSYLLYKGLGLEEVGVYDPAVEGRDTYPNKKYHFITCTDVMEHVPEEEIDDVLVDVWHLQEKGALFMIALREASAILPNGENAHCTVQPKEWWEDRLKKVFKSVTYLPNISKDYCAGFLVS